MDFELYKNFGSDGVFEQTRHARRDLKAALYFDSIPSIPAASVAVLMGRTMLLRDDDDIH